MFSNDEQRTARITYLRNCLDICRIKLKEVDYKDGKLALRYSKIKTELILLKGLEGPEEVANEV